MTDYVFRSSTRISGIDAQTAGEELARIQDQHGELTAPLVVDEARPNDATLHPVFEWDDAIAAEQHRQHQARNLIRSVQVVTPEQAPLPAYVHIQSLGSYMPANQVVRHIDLYEEAYRNAIGRINEAQHSLEQLTRLASATNKEHINSAIDRLSSITSLLSEAKP